MGRPADRLHAAREAALERMACDMFLPARGSGERHGQYFTRCALLWLRGAASRDPEQLAEVLRLLKARGIPPSVVDGTAVLQPASGGDRPTRS